MDSQSSCTRHRMSICLLLDKIRSIATFASDQASRFEELMRLYFLQDFLYRQQFSNVWLWKGYPEHCRSCQRDCDVERGKY